MKSYYKTLLIIGAFIFMLTSCQDEFGNRKESEPIINEASISPATFNFGDSIRLNAKIEDKATKLTMLYYEVADGQNVLSSGQIPLGGESFEVDHPIFVPLVKNQTDNADLILRLTATNILKGTSYKEVSGIKGMRPVFDKLYLVTDAGSVVTLNPQSANKETFEAENMTLDASFSYKIAQKLTADNSIDYSSAVFGNLNGHLGMIDEHGESRFSFVPNMDYTKHIVLDMNSFDIVATGDKLDKSDFSISNFDNMEISSEAFRTMKVTLEKDKTYSLFGRMADKQNIYNPDFFERVADDQVKFLRNSGEYTLYYNPVRKNIIVGVDNPSFPEYLLACGWGLGYPTDVSSATIAETYPGKQRTHTDWGFDNILKFVLLPRIADGIYQGTFYTPGDQDRYAGFKPFENTDWGNEKKAGSFTFTGLSIIKGDDNWEIPNGTADPVVESTNYRFTINLNNNTVNIEKVNL